MIETSGELDRKKLARSRDSARWAIYDRWYQQQIDSQIDRRPSGLDLRTKRQRWLATFAENNRRTREWINWAEIAEYCAHQGQPDIRANEAARQAAYDGLCTALIRGDFEKAAGQTQVLFLCERVRLNRITRELFELFPSSSFGSPVFSACYLRYFWIPRDCTRLWFERHAREVPEVLLSPLPGTVVYAKAAAHPQSAADEYNAGTELLHPEPLKSRKKPGPKPGQLNRFAKGDALLYPEIAKLVSDGGMSRTGAIGKIIADGKAIASNSEQATTERLRSGFRKWEETHPTRPN